MQRNVNIPWLTKGMGDGDYMYAFQQVVMPIAREFDPDFVIGMSYHCTVWSMR
jgi:histone deacetylase 6